MPRISLSSISTNYTTRTGEFILSTVLPSTCSYEYPVLIRSKEELDAFMGTEIQYRYFYYYLLDNNITLFFYRPIYDDIPVDEYGVLLIDESTSWNNRDTIRIWNKDPEYTWYKNELGEIITFSFDHCYPSYRKVHSDGSGIPSGIDYGDPSSEDYYKYPYKYVPILDAIHKIDQDLLDSDRESLAFTLDFSKVTYDDFFPKDGEGLRYIVLPDILGASRQIWFNPGTSQVPPLAGNVISSKSIEIPIRLTSKGDEEKKRLRDEYIRNVIDSIRKSYDSPDQTGLGYDGVGTDGGFCDVIERDPGNIYEIYSHTPSVNRFFYEFNNLEVTGDFFLTNDILSAGTEEVKQLEFFSRTIGWNDQDLTVSITRDVSQDKYLIEIKRAGLVEYYEVKLTEEPDMYGNRMPIQSTINSKSRLVTCKYTERKSPILDSDGNETGEYQVVPLPEGTYTLKRSYTEEYYRGSYLQALEIMKDTTVLEDFLLVDNLLDWRTPGETMISRSDLVVINDYVKEKNCQALISTREFYDDSTPGEVTYYREYSNILPDAENRMVYFYGELYSNYLPIPQYYVFLKGIFSDKYSVDETDIVVLMNDSEDNIRILNDNCINYLSYNNMEYYYDKLSGFTSLSTITTRYAVSRVSRLFINNKWKLLGLNSRERNQGISDIITYIKSSISLISSITVTSTEQYQNTLVIKLDLRLSSLVNSDVSLNITLNFNS